MNAGRALATIVAAAIMSPVVLATSVAHADTPVAVDADAGSIVLDERFDTATVDVRLDPFAAPVAPVAPSVADRPDLGPDTGPQVATTNAAAWHAAGITGAGVRVGVVDYFDVAAYWNVDEHGPAPVAGATARCYEFSANCTNTYFDGVTEFGDDHGVAVVEIIKDMAPDAEIYIGTARTLNDYRLLIDWFASKGVTILSRSLSGGYDGPGDGRSALNDIAGYANSRGITWVNSAGNAGSGRYYRQPVRLVGNRVAFGPSGSATFLPFNGCVALNGVRWATDWDLPPEERTDYDVYLWDSPRGDPAGGRIVDSSTGRQQFGAVPIEFFVNDHCPSGRSRTLYLEIRRAAGDPAGDVIEVLDAGDGIVAFTQAAYSASASIADSRLDGVLAVGAVDPPGGGALADYSSSGPTNDGRLAPDVSAPAGMYSTVFGSGFSGTSAAAPVVAGGAALLASARLAADPGSLGNLVRHLVVDRGAPGPDQQYGSGEFALPAPPEAVDARPSAYVAGAPVRLLDTRPTSPVGPANLTGAVQPGGIVDLPLAGAVPPGTTAVAVNVTAVGFDRPAFVQALPTLAATLGGFSNVNTDAAGQTRSNFAIVPVGSGGSISLSSTAAGHLVVDLLGTFTPTDPQLGADAGRFVPLAASERVLDTRTTAAPLRSGTSIAVPWPATINRNRTDALVVTVTGTGASGPGWLQAYPAGATGVVGTTSTVNLAPISSIANTAIVPVGTGGIEIAGFVAGDGTSDVIVDVIGSITSAAAPVGTDGRFVPVAPGRAFDSRAGNGPLGTGAAVVVDANTAPGVAVPAGASGIVWNLVPLDPDRPGFGRVHAVDATMPTSSAFNWSRPDEVRATAVISAATRARVRVTIHDASPDSGAPLGGVLADVLGYFT
jgi:hypothetical protein